MRHFWALVVRASLDSEGGPVFLAERRALAAPPLTPDVDQAKQYTTRQGPYNALRRHPDQAAALAPAEVTIERGRPPAVRLLKTFTTRARRSERRPPSPTRAA